MSVKFKYKASARKKKKRIDWKKRLLYFILLVLIANSGWDAYNRIPKIKVFTETYYSKALKLFDKIYKD